MFIIWDRCVDVIWTNIMALCRAFDSLNVFASDPVMFFWLFVQFTICLKLWAGYAANAVGDQEAPPHYLDPGTTFVLWWLHASLRFPAIGRESCLYLIQTQRTMMDKKPIKPKSGGCWNMNPVTPRSLFRHCLHKGWKGPPETCLMQISQGRAVISFWLRALLH